MFSKQMELVKQVLPNADRVLVIRHAELTPVARAVFLTVEAAARTLGLRLEVSGVRGAADIERVFDQVGRSRALAVFAFDDPLMFTHMPLIAKLALKQRLPSIFFHREGVEAGGLASHGTNVYDPPVMPRPSWTRS
jgi:putative ABC transport system substrate-binding protein